MGYDYSTYSPMLREVVDDTDIIEAVNRDTVGLEVCEARLDTTRFKEGKYIEFPAITQGGEGGGTIGEDVVLPDPGNHSTARSRFNVVHDYQRCRISGPVLDASQTDEQAIAEVFTEAMRSAKKDIRNRWNWQFMIGDGSGLLGAVTAAGSTTSITVADARFIRAGMTIAYLNTSDATYGGTIKDSGGTDRGVIKSVVSSVTYTTFPAATVVLATAIASTTNPTQFGVYLWNGFAKHPFGLFAGASTSNPGNQGTRYLGNINRSTAGNEWFKAQPDVAAGSNQFDLETVVDPALDSVELGQFGGEVPDIVFTSKKHWNYLGHTLRDDVRYMGEQRITKAGFQEIYYNKTRFYYDRMFPDGYAIALHHTAVRRSILRKTFALNRGGGELQQFIDSNGRYDSWEFTLCTRFANCFINPALMVKITGIATT